MSERITFDCANEILNKVNTKNKLTFIEFQQIFSYLYKKVQISLKLIKKKSLIVMNLNRVYDILNKLEIIVQQNLIQDEDLKPLMKELIDDLKKEIKDKGVLVC